MAVLLRRFRADFTLVEAYKHRAKSRLTCPITAFCGTDDRQISSDQLRAWEIETSNRFRLHLLPGGHFFIQDSRAEMLALIRAELER